MFTQKDSYYLFMMVTALVAATAVTFLALAHACGQIQLFW